MDIQERKYTINNSIFTIRFGNILESNAEVIVSSDDNYLSMGGGVSASIKIGAGDSIRRDTQKLVPADLGDVLVSTAGNLPQKYVFHCITLLINRGKRIRPKDEKTQQLIIWKCIEKCFRLMSILNIQSISYPPIGARVARYSLEDIAKNMAEHVTTFCYNTNRHYDIELCISNDTLGFDMMDYIVFFEEISKCISKYGQGSGSVISQFNKKIIQENTEGVIKSRTEHKDIFISYSRANQDKAQLFCKKLDEMGLSYWIDVEGNYSGNNYKEEIVDAIEKSSIVLFLSSKESNQSRNVIREISLAVGLNKRILPIRLDDTQYAKSLRYDLSDIDWIDFNGIETENAIQKFMNSIILLLDRNENKNT